MATYNLKTQSAPSAYAIGDIIEMPYKGNEVYTLQLSNLGSITIECWGGCGRCTPTERNGDAGIGGYVKGDLDLTKIRKLGKTCLYGVVGQSGFVKPPNKIAFGGGGGGEFMGSDNYYICGGGASDIRTEYNPDDRSYTNTDPRYGSNQAWRTKYADQDKGTTSYNSLNSRIIVAGGGGASDYSGGAKADGTPGGYINPPEEYYNNGGQSYKSMIQTGNGDDYDGDNKAPQGIFGIGGSANNGAQGSGGGWFGGSTNDGGFGGSSYVAGYSGCAANKDGIVLTNITVTPIGSKTRRDNSIGNVMNDDSGYHGHIKITVLSLYTPAVGSKILHGNTESVQLYNQTNIERIENDSKIEKIKVARVNNEDLYARAKLTYIDVGPDIFNETQTYTFNNTNTSNGNSANALWGATNSGWNHGCVCLPGTHYDIKYSDHPEYSVMLTGTVRVGWFSSHDNNDGFFSLDESDGYVFDGGLAQGIYEQYTNTRTQTTIDTGFTGVRQYIRFNAQLKNQVITIPINIRFNMSAKPMDYIVINGAGWGSTSSDELRYYDFNLTASYRSTPIETTKIMFRRGSNLMDWYSFLPE